MKWKPDTTAQLIGIKVETANQSYFCLLNGINLPQVKKMYRNLLTLPDRIHHFFLLNKNKADIVTLNDLQNNINLFFCVPWIVARSKKKQLEKQHVMFSIFHWPCVLNDCEFTWRYYNLRKNINPSNSYL